VVDTTAPVLTTTAAAVSHTTSDVSHPTDTGNVAGATHPSAAPVVDSTAPALTTTAAAVSHTTSDVSHPTDTGNVASATHPSAAPVVDTTAPALTTTAAAVSHTTSDVSHPTDTGNVASHTLPSAALDTGTGQAAGPAETLLALATSTDAPTGVPGSATAAPANVATGASNAAASVHSTAITGDVIALHDASPPPAHALFTGTQYTHYGITLSSDTAAPPQHAASPANAASAHDTSVPVVADVQKHALLPPDNVDTSHPIDHLGHAIL
jgi:hypothetical protein